MGNAAALILEPREERNIAFYGNSGDYALPGITRSVKHSAHLGIRPMRNILGDNPLADDVPPTGKPDAIGNKTTAAKTIGKRAVSTEPGANLAIPADERAAWVLPESRGTPLDLPGLAYSIPAALDGTTSWERVCRPVDAASV